MKVYYSCPHCDHDIEVEVIGGCDDLPEACPDCNQPLPASAHEVVAEKVREREDCYPDFP